MRRGRRRLIALWVLLAVVVVGGMAAVWSSRQDSSPGATVAVGFSPQGVLVDGRSRHVLTLDDIGVDRQGRYLQTGAVSMLDAATGAVLRSVPVGRNPIWMASDERTRRAFVVVLGLGGANSLLVRTLDTQTGAVLRTATLLTSTTTSGSVRLGPGAVAVDERAGHVFVVNRVSYPPAPVAPLLWMLDARSGRLLRTLRLPAPPFAIAIDQRTRHAFVTSAARAVMWMLDAESGTLLRPIPLSAGATTVAVDQRTDQVIAATSGATGRITLFDARTGQPRRTIAVGAYPSMMLVDERRDHAFLLDQGALLGNAPGSVRTIDLRHGRLLRTVTVGVKPVAMALHERRGRVFIVNQETATRRGTVSVLAASTGRLLTTIPVGFQPSALAVDESTGHVFVTSQSATVPRTDALSAVIARVRQIMAVHRGDNRGIVTILNAGVSHSSHARAGTGTTLPTPTTEISTMQGRSDDMLKRKIAVILPIVLVLGGMFALFSYRTGSPVYSVAQVRRGLISRPTLWLGRTVWIRALDIYPGGGVARLIDPGGNPYSQGLPITAGPWQRPTFPRTLIWWLGSNVHALRGIDGGRVEVYRITLTTPLRRACSSCVVGHGQ